MKWLLHLLAVLALGANMPFPWLGVRFLNPLAEAAAGVAADGEGGGCGFHWVCRRRQRRLEPPLQ